MAAVELHDLRDEALDPSIVHHWVRRTYQVPAAGEGPIGWLEVALYRDEERIAASVTDDDGEVLFRLPASLGGRLTLVVDSTFRHGLIMPGERLGEIDLPER